MLNIKILIARMNNNKALGYGKVIVDMIKLIGPLGT
jgi:hypothetical protein